MSKLPLLLLLSVAFPLAACESMPRAASAPEAAGDGGEDEADDSPREEAEKAERALGIARLEMSIAQAGADASKRKAADEVASSERKLDEARKALEHFRGKERELEMSKVALGLDQAAWRVEAEKQELAELEAMYKKDDVATLTKELVLQRGKKGVEFAERDLAHEQRDAELKSGFELPKKERELAVEVQEAEIALREARAEAEKTQLEIDLALRKARDEVADAEKALTKAQKKASKAKP